MRFHFLLFFQVTQKLICFEKSKACSTQMPPLRYPELVSPDQAFLLIGRRNTNTAPDFINTSMVFQALYGIQQEPKSQEHYETKVSMLTVQAKAQHREGLVCWR